MANKGEKVMLLIVWWGMVLLSFPALMGTLTFSSITDPITQLIMMMLFPAISIIITIVVIKLPSD